MTTGRRRLFWLLLAFGLYLAVETLSWTGLRLLEATRGVVYEPRPTTLDDYQRGLIGLLAEDRYFSTALHPLLGWVVKPSELEFDDPRSGREVRQTITREGVRGRRIYGSEPQGDALRVAAFGDSFTFGTGVGDEDTWPWILEGLAEDLEVMNFGVGGYGVDQALLRYLIDGRRFGADVVLIGFAVENIHRHVNVYRPFYVPRASLQTAKPRFVQASDEGELELLSNPLPEADDYRRLLRRPATVLEELGRDDFYYRTAPRPGFLDALPSWRLGKLSGQVLRRRVADDAIVRQGVYNVRSEAFRVTLGIVRRFYETVREDGARPLVVILPDRPTIEAFRSGGEKIYQPLLDALEEEGRAHVDLMPLFAGESLDRAFNPPPDVHYAPPTNAAVARALHDRLAPWLAEHHRENGDDAAGEGSAAESLPEDSG